MDFHSNLLSEDLQNAGAATGRPLQTTIIQAPETDVKPNQVSVPGQVTPPHLVCSSFLSLLSHRSSKARHRGCAGSLSLLRRLMSSPCHCLKGRPGAAGAQQPVHSRGLVSSATQTYTQVLGTFSSASAWLPSLVLVFCPAFSLTWADSCIAPSLKDAERNF